MTTTTLDHPVTVPLEPSPEQPTRQRLSDALRKGACLHPQARGSLYLNGRTCAVGAVLVGLLGPQAVNAFNSHTETLDSLRITALVQQYTGADLNQVVCMPPQYGPRPTTLSHALIALNDIYRWTREDIASWLESQGL